MDIRPSEQQILLRESAVRFLREEYSFERRRALIAPLQPADPGLWSKLSELGWPGAWLSAERGGLGGTIIELSVLMEELGRALYVGPFLSTVATGAAILQSIGGRDTQSLLLAVATGETRLAFAHGEPGGRGFFDRPEATATRVLGGSRYRLNGRKRLVHDAQFADRLIVSAIGPGGVSLFLADTAATKLGRRDYRTIDNGYASDFELDGVEAEPLGEPADTAKALDEAFYAAMVSLGAEAIGVADMALRHTQDYVSVRKQFGKALTDFQVVQHRLADMFVEIEQLRAALLDALSLAAEGGAARRRSAVALKVLAGQVSMQVAGQGLHLHGGMGMTDEMPISHYYRRARVIEAQFGNTDYFLADYAQWLGKAVV